MKQLILALALVSLAVPVNAQPAANVSPQPTAQEIKDSKQTKVLLNHEQKIKALQENVKVLENEVEILGSAVYSDLNKRVGELEREMRGKDGNGGVKQQVTNLHSKKADK